MFKYNEKYKLTCSIFFLILKYFQVFIHNMDLIYLFYFLNKDATFKNVKIN